jgi:surface antigen
MSLLKMIATALVAMTVGACAADPYSPTPRQDSGAVAGALGGAALGAILGGRGTGSRVAGAAIGAVAGGLVGSAVGASLDERDRQMAYAAEMEALEQGAPGAAVGWRSEHSTYYGNVVPVS